MTRHVTSRVILLIPWFLLITFLCYAIVDLAPGDPYQGLAAGRRVEDVERLRHAAGLDRPLLARYGRWLGRLARGDLGTSLVTRQPVAAMVRERLPATLALMGTALAVGLLAGIALGVVAAVRRDTWIDYLTSAGALVGLSVPVFWLGVMAILVFSVQTGWLPSGGVATIGTAFSWGDRLRHLILPAGVLAWTQLPLWSRHVRACMQETLQADFVRTARAKGVPESQVVLRHALRPSLGPVVTLLGLQVPSLLTGAVITETIFYWPGIGRLFYDGVAQRDEPRVMGILALAAALVLLGNLVADLVQARLDPRAREETS